MGSAMKITKVKLIVALVFLSAFASFFFVEFGSRDETKAEVIPRAADPQPHQPMPAVAPVLSKLASAPLATSRETADLFQAWLLDGTSEQRESLLDNARKNPAAFARAARIVISKLPEELVLVRSQVFALLVDAADQLLIDTSLPVAESSVFFAESKAMAIAEMSVPEFVHPQGIDKLSDAQKDSFLHQGFLIEKDGALVKSTMGSKVVALHLVGRFPNPADRVAVVSELSASPMAPFTQQTLQIVAKRDALNQK